LVAEAELYMSNYSIEIMTIQETSDFLRIPLSSLYKLAQQGKIPCQKVGRHWRFHKQALEKWFEKFPADEQVKFDLGEMDGSIDNDE
jgi:excisionase family DNA binding protein